MFLSTEKDVFREANTGIQDLLTALDDLNQSAKKVQNELIQVNRLLNLNPESIELTAIKLDLLNQSAECSVEKLDLVNQCLMQADALYAQSTAGIQTYAEQITALNLNLTDIQSSLLYTAEGVTGLDVVLNTGTEALAGYAAKEADFNNTMLQGEEPINNLIAKLSDLNGAYDQSVANAKAWGAYQADFKQQIDELVAKIQVERQEIDLTSQSLLGFKKNTAIDSSGFTAFTKNMTTDVEKAIESISKNILSSKGDFSKIQESLDDISGGIKDLCKEDFAGFKSHVKGVFSALSDVGLNVRNIFGDAVADSVDAASGVIDFGKNLVGIFTEANKEVAKRSSDGMSDAAASTSIYSIAIDLLSGKINIASAATQAFSLVTQALGGPVGLLITGIAALTVGIIAYCSTKEDIKSETELFNEQLDEEIELLKKEKEEYDAFVSAQQSRLKGDLYEIDNVSKMIKELNGLIDSEGNIVGNKDKALALMNEINKLYPDLIEFTSEEKIQYKETADALDLLIAKKKTQAIIDAKMPEYTKAIREQYETSKKLSEDRLEQQKVELQIAEKQREIDKINNEFKDTSRYMTDDEKMDKAAKLSELSAQQEELRGSYDRLSVSIAGLTETENQHAQVIQDVNNLNMAAVSDNLEFVVNTNNEIGGSYRELTKTRADEQEKVIQNEIETLGRWLQEHKKGNKAYDDKVIQDQLERVGVALKHGKTLGETLSEAEIKALESKYPGISQAISKGVDGAVEFAKQSEESSKLGVQVTDKIIAGVKSNQTIFDAAISASVKTAFENAKSNNATTFGSDLAKGIVSGFQAHQGIINGVVVGVATAAIEKSRKKLEINSPSRKTAREIGRPFAKGIAKGITDTTPTVVSEMNTLVHQAVKGISTTASATLSQSGAAIDKSSSELQKQIINGVGNITDLVKPVKLKTSSILQIAGDSQNLMPRMSVGLPDSIEISPDFSRGLSSTIKENINPKDIDAAVKEGLTKPLSKTMTKELADLTSTIDWITPEAKSALAELDTWSYKLNFNFDKEKLEKDIDTDIKQTLDKKINGLNKEENDFDLKVGFKFKIDYKKKISDLENLINPQGDNTKESSFESSEASVVSPTTKPDEIKVANAKVNKEISEDNKRSYEDQLRDLQNNQKEVVGLYDKLGKEVTDVVKTQYEGLRDAQKAQDEDNINTAKENSKRRIEIYEEEYKKRVAFLNNEENEDIKKIQRQIDAIDNLTKQEDKFERDRQDRMRLDNLLDAVNSAETDEEKYEAQKRYNEELQKQQRVQLLEQREQEKQNLRDEIDRVKDKYKQRRDEEKEDLEKLKETEAERLNVELGNLKTLKEKHDEYWKNKLSDEALQQESLKKLVDTGSANILTLMRGYYTQWENAGKSMGEKLIAGLESMRGTWDSTVASFVNNGESDNKAKAALSINSPAVMSLPMPAIPTSYIEAALPSPQAVNSRAMPSAGQEVNNHYHNSFNFYSPKPIDANEAKRLTERTFRKLALDMI